jgi:L-fucose mutarotase
MLKLIDNRLTAEVLYTLQKMGHGDILIIADANFPSTTISKSTVSQSVLNMENLNAPEAIEAILSLLPLDSFVDDFAGRMEVDGEPDFLPPVQDDVAKIVRANDDESRDMISIDRQAFYDQLNPIVWLFHAAQGCYFSVLIIAISRRSLIPR